MSVNIYKIIVLLCVVIELQCQKIRIKTRSDRKEYQFFPLQNDYFEVDVKANNDVHIVLTETFAFVGKYYEIVYGGWVNTKSVIRRDSGSNVKVVVDEPVVNSSIYDKYWVQIDRINNTVSTGKVPNKVPYMVAYDKDMFPVSYFGISTGYGSSGDWHIDTKYIVNKSQ